MWGKNCLNVGVFLVMVFVLFSCKKDPVDLGFEVNADDPITFVWNDSGGKTFTVTSNSGWYIYMAGQESWCQALISEGKRGHDQVVTLKVNSENSYITEREMELYVRNEEGDILTVKVMQEGNPTSSGAFVISDRVFHEYCLDEFDTDKDGKLSVGEAAAVKTIDVSDLRIRSMIDLTSFPALDTLRCNEMMELKKLDVSAMKSLRYLECNACYGLDTLVVNGADKLEFLSVRERGIPRLDVSGLKMLRRLDCYMNRSLEELVVNGADALRELDCGWIGVKTLDVSECKSLETLICSGCESLESLTVNGANALLKLDISSTSLKALDVSDLKLIKHLYCGFSKDQLGSLVVNGTSFL